MAYATNRSKLSLPALSWPAESQTGKSDRGHDRSRGTQTTANGQRWSKLETNAQCTRGRRPPSVRAAESMPREAPAEDEAAVFESKPPLKQFCKSTYTPYFRLHRT